MESDAVTNLKSSLEVYIADLIQELAQAPDLPKRRWIRIEKQKDGEIYITEERNDWWLINFRLSDYFLKEPSTSLLKVFESVKSYPILSNLLLADAGGNPIPPEGHQTWFITQVIPRFIEMYFSDFHELLWDQGVFDSAFSRLVIGLKQPDMIIKHIVPIPNLDLDTDSIRISDDIVIRKLTTKEIERWLNYPPFGSLGLFNLPVIHASSFKSAIEVTFIKGESKVPWEGYQKVIDKTNNLVTSLRLFKNCSVRGAFYEDIAEDFRFNRNLQPFWGSIETLGSEVRLTSAEEHSVCQLYNQVCEASDGPRTLPIRRWNMVCERKNEDDVLIDSWVALEALFASDSSQEVKYRGSLRVAAFLGLTPSESQEIYNNCSKSYAFRSNLVHGKSTVKFDRQLITKTRQYLRDALVKVLAMPSFKPEVIEKLLLEKACPLEGGTF